MAKNKWMEIGIFGGIVTLLTNMILLPKVIIPLLNIIGGFMPQLSLKLADPGTITLSVRESLTGIQDGLAGWVLDLFGMSVSVPMMGYVMAFAGGALFFIAGAWLAEQMGQLKGNAMQKTRAVIFFGSALTAFALSWGINNFPEFGIDFLNVLIAMGVNAAVLAWAITAIDKNTKTNFSPFKG